VDPLLALGRVVRVADHLHVGSLVDESLLFGRAGRRQYLRRVDKLLGRWQLTHLLQDEWGGWTTVRAV
jgi:hypothetical protein